MRALVEMYFELHSTKFGVACRILKRVQDVYSFSVNNSIELLYFINGELYLVSQWPEVLEKSPFPPSSVRRSSVGLWTLFYHLPFLGKNGDNNSLPQKPEEAKLCGVCRGFGQCFRSKRGHGRCCRSQAVLRAVRRAEALGAALATPR